MWFYLGRMWMKKVFYSVFILLCVAFFLDGATFTVTNTLDSGLGSLRDAVGKANASPGSTIVFNIPGTGVHTITLASALLIEANQTIIDGRTQPGFSGTPLIEIDCSGTLIGFVIDANHCALRSLIINNGINAADILGNNNAIYGCFLGTDATGTVAIGSFAIAVVVEGSNNKIGGRRLNQGNLISGADIAISLNNTQSTPAFNNVIRGNLIGVNITGAAPLPNILGIVTGNALGTIIGGRKEGDGNVISSNLQFGIVINNTSPESFINIVRGNYIGTDITGTLNLGNGAGGIALLNGHSLIGGTLPGEANIIEFNNPNGIVVNGSILNPILENSIFNNVGKAILLENGGNDLQLPPTVESAIQCRSGNNLIIAYKAPSTPAGARFRLEFFTNQMNRNSSGITEGEQLIGAVDSVPAGKSRIVVIPGTFTGFVSATATNLNGYGKAPGDTSEYSLNTRIHSDRLAVSIKARPTTICLGDSSKLTAHISGKGPFTIKWSDGFTETDVFSPVSHVVSPTSSKKYSAKVTDSIGCSARSNKVTVEVGVSSLSLKAFPDCIVPGRFSTLEAKFKASDPVTLVWSDGLVQRKSKSPTSREVSPTRTTTYTVKAILDNCEVTSNSVKVKVDKCRNNCKEHH